MLIIVKLVYVLLSEKLYDYKTHCVICSEEIDPKHSRKPSHIEMMNLKNKILVIVQSHISNVVKEGKIVKQSKLKQD